jgi:hypothetical protein
MSSIKTASDEFSAPPDAAFCAGRVWHQVQQRAAVSNGVVCHTAAPSGNTELSPAAI